MLKRFFKLFLIFYLVESIISFPLKFLRRLADEKKAELTFVKIYDLLYTQNKFKSTTWTFKILLEDDEDLVDGTPFSLNMRLANINETKTAEYYMTTFCEEYCTYQKADHILNCYAFVGCSKSADQLIKFSPKNYSRFSIYQYGNVTWKNFYIFSSDYERDMDINLNHTFIFTKAYGAFFTDKWNFLISVINTGKTPLYSKVIIDIFHGTNQTTATCKLLYKGYNSSEEAIFCFSDSNKQTANDIIKINTKQKYGSIKWEEGINEYNNLVEFYPNEFKNIVLTLEDAYDLYFEKEKWFFTILAKNPSNQIDLAIYKVDIGVKKYNRINIIQSTADCYLIEGFVTSNSYPNATRLLCSCQYEDQNKDDLITLVYPKSTDGTITWSKSFSSPYAITLKTSINLLNTYWNSTSKSLNIEISDDGILPLNSKVTIDLIGISPSYDYYQSNCTAISKKLLICQSEEYISLTYGDPPKLTNLKSDKSSVTWKNYKSLELDVKYVTKKYYSDKKNWKIDIIISNKDIPLNTYIDIDLNITHGNYDYLTWAGCLLKEEDKFECYPGQWWYKSEIDLIEILTTLKYGSVVYKNSPERLKFMYHLGFKKAYNLYFDKAWVFDIELSYTNLEENQLITIDILIDNEVNEADCILKGKILTCEAQKESQNSDNIIKLIIKKNELFMWHEMPINVEIAKKGDSSTSSLNEPISSNKENSSDNPCSCTEKGNYLNYSISIILSLILLLL